MIIDVLVAGSANDQFYSNIAFLRRSLNWLGGDYRAARVVAALGEWDLPEVPARWQPHLRDVDIIWSNRSAPPTRRTMRSISTGSTISGRKQMSP